MSPNSALFLLPFLLFLILNRVGTANAKQPECKKACKKHRPPGMSGSYTLDCGTLSDDDENHAHSEQFYCGHCVGCPKKICDEDRSDLPRDVKLNCPNSAEDDVEDSATERPKKDDEGLTKLQVLYIILGTAGGVLVIFCCIYWIAITSIYRKLKRRHEMQGASTEPPPPPMTEYPGAGYGASPTSTVQQEKTAGPSAVS